MQSLNGLLFGICLLSGLGFTAESNVISQPHSKASLVSELDRVAPGSSFYIGLNLKLENHWHVYWKNPGDSGMAPHIDWVLPDGVEADGVVWPRPEKIPVAPLLNYGYHDEVLLPVKISVSESYVAKSLNIQGLASWLVCKEVCIPGNAELELTLEVGERSSSQRKADLEAALALAPQKLKLMRGTISEQGDSLAIELYAAKPIFAGAQKVEVFVADANLIEYAAPSSARWKNNYLNLSHPKAATFYKLPTAVSGVFVVDDVTAWEFVVSH